MAYVTEKRGVFYAVIYEGRNPVSGQERRRWHRCDDRAAANKLATDLTECRSHQRSTGSLLTLGDRPLRRLQTEHFETLYRRLLLTGSRRGGPLVDKPLHPHSVSQAFERAQRRLDLSPIRFHDLRHTHASLLHRDRVPIKVASERLGHSNSAFTMTTYQHVLPGLQGDAAAAFGQLRANHSRKVSEDAAASWSVGVGKTPGSDPKKTQDPR